MAKVAERISIVDFFLTGQTIILAYAVMPPADFAEFMTAMEFSTILDALDSPSFRESIRMMEDH